jgi:hypothetical protein
MPHDGLGSGGSHSRVPAPQGLRGLGPLGPHHVPQHHRDPGGEHAGASRRHQVQRFPAQTGRIGEDPARHAEQAQRMHRHEGGVEPDEHQPEGHAAEPFREQPPVDQRVVVVEAGQQREHRAANEHRVQVRDDEKGVVGLQIERRHCHHQPGESADDKRRDAADDVEHRHRPGGPAPDRERRRKAEELHGSGNRHRRRSGREDRQRQPRQPGREHVVHPQSERQEPGAERRQYHPAVADDRLPGGGRDDHRHQRH